MVCAENHCSELRVKDLIVDRIPPWPHMPSPGGPSPSGMSWNVSESGHVPRCGGGLQGWNSLALEALLGHRLSLAALCGMGSQPGSVPAALTQSQDSPYTEGREELSQGDFPKGLE